MNPLRGPRPVLAIRDPRPGRRIRPAVESFEDRMLLSVGSASASRRNVILFVADGLKPGSINPKDTPTMAALRDLGVNFTNTHSAFPTFTTPNAAALATGHYPGDTGDFGNTVYTGYPVLGGTNTPFLENDAVLGDIDEHFGGNFLGEESLLAIARREGFRTAAVGKLGPVLIQDVTQGNAGPGGVVPTPATVILDDSTGKAGGLALSPDIRGRLIRAGLGVVAPDRSIGSPSVAQRRYFADATTKAILPAFKAAHKPFALVYWSRDPDGAQHTQGDGLDRLTPGINGPTSRSAVREANRALNRIYNYLQANPNLARTTDLVVASDHGFSTISKRQVDARGNVTHAYASTLTYAGVESGSLPPGFVAIDLAHALDLPLFDPDATVARGKSYASVAPTRGQRPRVGNGLIGGTGTIANPRPTVVVAANGGSDLIYVPGRDPKVVARVVDFLSRQDYTSGLFVDDAFGPIPGTLPLGAIHLKGTAKLPTPAIVINFRTFSTNPADPLRTAVAIADTTLREGQGMHGSFGRQDTMSTMIAVGPDFREGFRDTAPAGNADIPITLARLLGLDLGGVGHLTGRVLTEALEGRNRNVRVTRGVLAGPPAADGSGMTTFLKYQRVGDTLYFDAAGYEGRTVGLDAGASTAASAKATARKKS